MNLRGRITLIVSICFLAFAGLLMLDGQAREAAVERRLEETVARGLRTTWAGLLDAERQRLLRYVEQVRGDPRATRAFVAAAPQRFAESTVATRARLRASVRRTHLQAVRPDGTPFYDTRTESPADPGAGVLTPAAVAEVVNRAEPVAGLVRGGDGQVVYALAAPIFGRAGIAGLLVLHTGLPDLVGELADLTGARTLVAGAGPGADGAGSAPERRVLELIEGGATAIGDGVLQLAAGDRDLQVALMGLSGPFAERLGTLAALRDVTAQTRRRELISRLSYFALACGVVLFLAFVNWYLRRSFRPLDRVIRSLNALSGGRTDVAVRVPTRDDEIGRLAGTFETFRRGMEAQLRLNRLQQELDVAARIQRQSLPSAFPERPGVGFAATMRAARDVGGDFYDVFDLPDGRIACVVGDVSDKGMGAALFMAASRTVIRSTAALAPDPADCLRRANDYLAQDNTAMMFVTLFYAVLDPASGEIHSCNAGHNPPARLGPDGTAQLLPASGQPALGVWEGFPYAAETARLAPGERLFLYTDGVTEAMTEASAEYGAGRMLAALQAAGRGAGAKDLVDRVLEDVTGFAGAAEQSDDITCLAVAYDGAA